MKKNIGAVFLKVGVAVFVTSGIAYGAGSRSDAAAKSPEPAIRADDISAAIRISHSPAMRRAIAEARQLWLEAKGRGPSSAEEERLLMHDLENRAFYVALISLNNDPYVPRVTQFGWQSFRGFGMEVPATGMVVNNQDNVYYHVPIDGSSSYVLSGKVVPPSPSDFSFKLADGWPNMVTVDTLAGAAVAKDADGSFSITIDSEPSKGRKNHLQTIPGKTLSLMIRETLGDWSTENPHQYSVKRVGGPAKSSSAEEDPAERAAALLIKYTKDMTRIVKRFSDIPMNTFTPPVNSGPGGGLAVQVNGEGQFHLNDDQALVITVDRGNTIYFNLQALDPWAGDLDVRHRTSEFNDKQSFAGPNGKYVYVVSAKDPGILNWLDVSGVPEGFLYARFQGFPGVETPSAESPAFPRMEVKLVKFSELETAGALAHTISPEQRKAQLAGRSKYYQRRVTPH